MLRALLSWTLWPLSVAAVACSVAHFADPQRAASIQTAAGRTLMVMLAVQLALELLLPYRSDWCVRGDRDVWRDVAHLLLYGQLAGFVSLLVFLGCVAPHLSSLHLPRLWPDGIPIAAQVLLVMFVGDALEYWLHRLSHALPALWRVHILHHMPSRLHMLKAGRHHLLYFPLRGLIVWTPLLLIGAPPQLIPWQLFAVAIVGSVAHANIDLRITGFMHRVLVTPQLHRIHHSADARQGNSNFAVMLPLWDLLFGTYMDPRVTRVREVGIEDDPVPHRLLVELLWPVLTRTAQAASSPLHHEGLSNVSPALSSGQVTGSERAAPAPAALA